ncbi:hypothetical protein ZIOFF_062453 [Zingiber officinale]|uniref:Uncharacterized protein n=1 Tax=Zingiber officinale TaxID=94328 RepID=A0A8J5F5I6_ZINOF|nr:hypothetical protein ZIOFF_062453 [Zingiber officinale]
MGFNVKLTSLASKVRDDVCLCCCVISGGVYENLLFFPVIQLIKDRYPGVQIDVVASPKGKQVYEVNKNVRWANVYDPDEDFPEPTEYVNMIGLLKLAGLGHAAFLFMTSTRDKVSYVYPNVNVAGAGLLLTETFTSPTMNLSECGYHMYDEMEEWLGRSFCSVPRHPVSPLRVPISKKLRAYVEEKYSKVGVRKGGFVVIHGIETDSVASMRSKGDSDSLLPIQVWVEIVKGLRYILLACGNRVVKPLFVIPHEKVREDVEEVVGDDTHIFFITTPGQLAALVDDAIRVIATNTAALQLANARNKPRSFFLNSVFNPFIWLSRTLSCDLSKRCVKDNYVVSVTPVRALVVSVTPVRALVVSVTPVWALVVSVTPVRALVVSVTPVWALVVSVTPVRALVVSVTPVRALVVSVTPVWALVVSVTPVRALVVSVTPVRALVVSVTPVRALVVSVTPVRALVVSVTPVWTLVVSVALDL